MPYATDAEFVLLIAGASAVDSALRLIALEDAMAFIDLDMFGAKARRAHVHLAAHFLSFMAGGLTPAAPVTAMSAGEISASFAVSAQGDPNDFGSTEHGRRFQEVAATIVAFPTAVL
jgi:hypothetical protein